MHICIVGPIATADIHHLLEGDTTHLPAGYPGAPLMATLITELLKGGHRVTTVTLSGDMPLDWRQSVTASGANLDVVYVPMRLRAWRFNGWLPGRIVDLFAFERRGLQYAIEQARPDVVHAHWTYEFALATLNTGLPHLITCHDAPVVVIRYTRSLYRVLRYFMARKVFRRGKVFSAVSGYMAQAAQHYTRLSISVIPNPLADYVLTSGHIRLASSTRQIGMICNGWGRLKNPEPALLAFEKIHRANPTAVLHVFGADFGPGEMAEQWCLDRNLAAGIVFHGATPHQQLIEHLENLDLLIHPALEESFGVVLAEAMALGVPIVAGRYSGAVPWVVGFDEKTANCGCAVLIDVTDVMALVAAVDTALDKHYAERSAFGYKRARQLFTPSKVVEAYERLYQDALCSSSDLPYPSAATSATENGSPSL